VPRLAFVPPWPFGIEPGYAVSSCSGFWDGCSESAPCQAPWPWSCLRLPNVPHWNFQLKGMAPETLICTGLCTDLYSETTLTWYSKVPKVPPGCTGPGYRMHSYMVRTAHLRRGPQCANSAESCRGACPAPCARRRSAEGGPLHALPPFHFHCADVGSTRESMHAHLSQESSSLTLFQEEELEGERETQLNCFHREGSCEESRGEPRERKPQVLLPQPTPGRVTEDTHRGTSGAENSNGTGHPMRSRVLGFLGRRLCNAAPQILPQAPTGPVAWLRPGPAMCAALSPRTPSVHPSPSHGQKGSCAALVGHAVALRSLTGCRHPLSNDTLTRNGVQRATQSGEFSRSSSRRISNSTQH